MADALTEGEERLFVSREGAGGGYAAALFHWAE